MITVPSLPIYFKQLRMKKFENAVEQEFILDYNRKSIIVIQVGIAVIFILGIGPYALLDKLAMPENYQYAWLIRFGIWAPFLIFSFYLTFRPGNFKYTQTIGIILNLVLSYGVLFMILISNKSELSFTNYSAGLLVTLSTIIILRIRAVSSIIIIVLVIISYLLVAIFVQKLHLPDGAMNYPVILTNNLFFLISVGFAVGVANYILEVSARFTFWHRNQLTLEKYKIQEKNEYIKVQNKKIKSQSDEVREIYQTKDKLFSVIAHDLKNPFNSILGFSDLLLESCQDNKYDNVEKYSRIIHDTSTKTFNLLNNLLDWSRIQTNQIKLNPIQINIGELIHEMVGFMHDFAEQKELILKADVPNDLFIEADRNMIQTIIRNLVSNAIKYSNRAGIITIKVIGKSENIEISVSDTGVGITEDEKELLFKINNKPSKPGTNNETGTGLGLLLCQNFITLHKGKIWVESHLGIGSTFKFQIPKSIPINTELTNSEDDLNF